jgi:hypothetical protein
MTTSKRLLVLAIAMALALAFATTATAKKPPKPPPEPPTVEACETDPAGMITLTPGSGFTSFECLWTPQNDGSTTGTVTVEATEGSISGLVVFVRDASPGNICVLQQEWDGPPFTASFPLADGDTDYWDFGGTHWCWHVEGFGMRDDPNGAPLHMLVNFRAKKNTTVEITLSPTQEAP